MNTAATKKPRSDRIRESAAAVSTALKTVQDIEQQLDALRAQRDAINDQIAELNKRRTETLGDIRRASKDLADDLDGANV